MVDQISLSLIEIAVLMLGAIILGVTIHFFITNHRSLKQSMSEDPGNKLTNELDEWKRRYFNDMDFKDRELEELRKKFSLSEDNNEINEIEAEEMRKLNKELKNEIENLKKNITQVTSTEKPDYIEQLRITQSGLLEQNSKINQLLQQINIVKESEEKHIDIIRTNEELAVQVDELNSRLSQKETELNKIRQKEHLTTEMKVMLDKAYIEFSTLQEKMQNLEMQVVKAKKFNIEYEEMKVGHHKILRDLEDERIKYLTAYNESVQLRMQLVEVEKKLKDADFQRQQLQKKVANLEELNTDMQVIADANKKLEGQIKRIGELESLLNIVLDEKNELAGKQDKPLS